jgi:murein DD-endopeptidase MepM/ murein hydrolase activator NlpD
MTEPGTIFRSAAAAAVLAIMAFQPLPASALNESEDIKEQIEEINSDVEGKKRDLAELQSKADKYRKIISEKKLESASLEDQIALIENDIAKTQLNIEIAKKAVEGLELEIVAINETIAGHEAQIVRERALLGNLARRLFRAQFRKSTFEILLSHRSFSEFFDAVQSIVDLQNGVRKSLTTLTGLNATLSEEKKGREAKQLAVAEQKRQLDVARSELEDERSLKQTILIETKSSELEYRYLLAELQREQNQADSEINYLERVLREKLDIADRLANQQTVLSWPVVPTRGLSTRFHDPEYPFRYVFEHPGIDIRASQSTPVRASAAGIVARAKDAGYGYSYVMLIHNNNVSTVYGHLVKILAKEDTFVERGEIIGYSGGMPGTPGAGRLTTGPHLHFETRFKGIPEDPLRYLVNF